MEVVVNESEGCVMLKNERYNNVVIPLTIESHLESFTKAEGHTDRHETLWHAWYQNKRWICQLLQTTLFSFPTYSRHDESHALSVLNNIEMILGQDRIGQLSASDCFVLLHAVYLHDIGMCILQADRKEIIQNEEFIDFMDILEKDGDENLRRAIKVLKQTDYSLSDGEEHISQMRQLYQAKLDVYYAIIEMLANFRRSEHGNKSAERLYEWTLEPEKLKMGFSMSGVPLRIFLAVARCAQMHTNNDFSDILKLPRRDGGYASDYYHPRFIAVLLMLGDILDMDNDRFHPMALEFVEDFPKTSRNHYDKHRAIRRLRISPDVIEIEADCENQDALRLVRKECDVLADILKNAGYLWSSICPTGFSGSLPNLAVTDLYLNNKKIPEELVTTQFHISQEKAFSILEGANIYENRYVFLREFLQNAVDATKSQYWMDYNGMSVYYGDNDSKLTPSEMNKKLPFDRYPIVIDMKIQRKTSTGELHDISVAELQKEEFSENDFGILVTVKDFGTGIDKQRIIAISKVGNSRKDEKKLLRHMPSWLQPTAEFGVGLQSAFLVNDAFKCYTHTRSGESYEITFSSGASSFHEGYINVAPIAAERFDSYGTHFEVFVPLEKKLLHSECVIAWSGKDPFSADYNSTKVLRHAAEMISQMILQLDGVLGELLFPVYLKIQDYEKMNLMINSHKDNTLKKMILENDAIDREKNHPYWLINSEKQPDQYFYGEMQGIEYALNYGNAHLYIWDSESDISCVVSGANIQNGMASFKDTSRYGKSNRGITIYYKGIELQKHCYEKEIEIFEYIDMKGSLKREYINISRRGFTAEGERYFYEKIYINLLIKVKTVLKDINEKSIENNEISPIEKLKDNLLKKLKTLSEMREKNDKKTYNEVRDKFVSQIVSLVILAHLAVKEVYDEAGIRGCGSRNKDCRWQKCISDISEVIDNYPVKNSVVEDLRESSPFFNIRCYRKKDGIKAWIPDIINVLDIFNQNRHYALFQKRVHENDRWVDYIFDIGEIFNQFWDYFVGYPDDKKHEEICVKIKGYFDDALREWTDITKPDDSGGENITQVLTESAQQYFLMWLGKNVPLIGLFSDLSGNSRINVLSHHMYSYIFTNDYFKMLVLQKMVEYSNSLSISRYSTFAWQGTQYLAVQKLPFSCYFVKRGYFNKAYLQKVIFPLDANWIKKIEDILKKEESYYCEYIRTLSFHLDIKAYLLELVLRYDQDKTMLKDEFVLVQSIKELTGQSGMNDFLVTVGEFFQDIMREIITANKDILLEKDDQEEKFDYLNYFFSAEKEWKKAFGKIISCYLSVVKGEQNQDDVKTLIQDQTIRTMAGLYHMIQDDLFLDSISFTGIKQLKEQYFDECSHNPVSKQKRERIIKYIACNSLYFLREEQIEKCYRMYENDIFDLFSKQERERIGAAIKARSVGQRYRKDR